MTISGHAVPKFRTWWRNPLHAHDAPSALVGLGKRLLGATVLRKLVLAVVVTDYRPARLLGRISARFRGELIVY